MALVYNTYPIMILYSIPNSTSTQSSIAKLLLSNLVFYSRVLLSNLCQYLTTEIFAQCYSLKPPSFFFELYPQCSLMIQHLSELTSLELYSTSKVMILQQTNGTVYKLKPRLFWEVYITMYFAQVFIPSTTLSQLSDIQSLDASFFI